MGDTVSKSTDEEVGAEDARERLMAVEAEDARKRLMAVEAEAARKRLKDKSTKSTSGNINIYKVDPVGESSGLRGNHYFVGDPSQAEERVLLLMGQTGAGKTTITNWLLNYVYGVEYSDEYRFQLADQRHHFESDTDKITSYTIYHHAGMKIPYTLTIVDTPGFVATGGMDADRKTKKQLEEYFGVDNPVELNLLHCVAILVRAGTPRLSLAEKYGFDCITEIFGKDIAENIVIFFTFADQCEPAAMRIVNEANIPFRETFTFNNGSNVRLSTSGLEKKDSEEDEISKTLNKLWWTKGEHSTKTFLEMLNGMPAIPTRLTKKTLHERRTVEQAVHSINECITSGLVELNMIAAIQKAFSNNAEKLNGKTPFTVVIKEEVLRKENLTDDTKATNCKTCQYTCHSPCRTDDRRSRAYCSAMGLGGYCTSCPEHCSYANHTTNRFIYVRTLEEVKKTSETLIQDFMQATNPLYALSPSCGDRAEAIDSYISSTITPSTLEIISAKVKEVIDSSKRLYGVAMMPNLKDTSEYIDQLIKMENQLCAPGYVERIGKLEPLKGENLVANRIVPKK